MTQKHANVQERIKQLKQRENNKHNWFWTEKYSHFIGDFRNEGNCRGEEMKKCTRGVRVHFLKLMGRKIT